MTLQSCTLSVKSSEDTVCTHVIVRREREDDLGMHIATLQTVLLQITYGSEASSFDLTSRQNL